MPGMTLLSEVMSSCCSGKQDVVFVADQFMSVQHACANAAGGNFFHVQSGSCT